MIALPSPPPAVAAWIPFLEPMPIDFHQHWLWLLPPLVFVVALVLKTLKMPTLDGLLAETLRLTGVILAVMAIAAASLWILVENV